MTEHAIGSKITRMANDYQTIKIRTATYRRLKILAAERGEKLVDLIDRLAESDTRSDTRRADMGKQSDVQHEGNALGSDKRDSRRA